VWRPIAQFLGWPPHHFFMSATMIDAGDIVNVRCDNGIFKIGIIIVRDTDDTSALMEETFYQVMLHSGELQWFLITDIKPVN